VQFGEKKERKKERKKKQTEEKVGTENKAWMVAPRQESSLARVARAGAEAARQSPKPKAACSFASIGRKVSEP
jgi:hypothetical protein